jgi:hypothetical protein
MTYSTHKILKDGHIEVRQTKDDGTYHRHVIAPNESIDSEPEDVKQAILADPNYEMYRTEENAEAYEQRLNEIIDL